MINVGRRGVYYQGTSIYVFRKQVNPTLKRRAIYNCTLYYTSSAADQNELGDKTLFAVKKIIWDKARVKVQTIYSILRDDYF